MKFYECTKNRVGVKAVSTGSVGNNIIFRSTRAAFLAY